MNPRLSILNRLASAVWTPRAAQNNGIHPFFANLWTEIGQSMKGKVLRLHEDVISTPNQVEVFFNPDDYEELIAPNYEDASAAIDKVIYENRARLDFPESASVVYHFFVAEPEQLEVPRGKTIVRCARVSNPWAVEDAWKDGLRKTTMFGSLQAGAPASASPAPAGPLPRPTPSPGPATAPSKDFTPLAILRWTDATGAHKESIFVDSEVGRADPASSVEIQLDPGPEGSKSDLWALSRRALRIEAGREDGRAHLVNLGQWPLSATNASAAIQIPPGGVLPVAGAVELCWPDVQGAEGFRLSIEAPRVGVAIVEEDGSRQRFILRAPETVVSVNLQDGTLFRARLDLSTRPSGFLMLEPLSVHILRHQKLQFQHGRPGQLPATPGTLLEGSGFTFSVQLDPN